MESNYLVEFDIIKDAFVKFLIKLPSIHVVYLMDYSPEISSTVSHTGLLETDSSSILFACVLDGSCSSRYRANFPTPALERHPSFATWARTDAASPKKTRFLLCH